MVQKPFYPALVHNMTFGPVLLLLVAGTDVYDVLTMAKGMFRSKDGQIEKSGLRLKYQGPSRQELVELGYEGERLLFRLFEYRIHTCDNLKETLAICKLLLSEGDYNVLVDELKGL